MPALVGLADFDKRPELKEASPKASVDSVNIQDKSAFR